MVACATPHWGPQWLGGSSQSVNTVVSNCVQKNAWALKQLLQTAPAILFLVGQSSWDMFREFFGDLMLSTTPLPKVPEDGPYTLLRLTTDQECRFEISATVEGQTFSLSTRVVITPHFSYDENFLPQFRLSPSSAKRLESQYPAAVAFLKGDPRVTFQAPAGSFVTFAIDRDAPGVLADLKTQDAAAAAQLTNFFYDPHAMMASTLMQMYAGGELSYTAPSGNQAGYLTRSKGPCTFCVNNRWTFPQGCPYRKPEEIQFPVGFLEQVCAAVIDKSTTAHIRVVAPFAPKTLLAESA